MKYRLLILCTIIVQAAGSNISMNIEREVTRLIPPEQAENLQQPIVQTQRRVQDATSPQVFEERERERGFFSINLRRFLKISLGKFHSSGGQLSEASQVDLLYRRFKTESGLARNNPYNTIRLNFSVRRLAPFYPYYAGPGPTDSSSSRKSKRRTIYSLKLGLASLRRAGHFRYLLTFSIIKNDFIAYFIKLVTYFCTSPI